MKKILKLKEKTIEYAHKLSKRTKRLRLAVYPGGEVVLTTPVMVPESLINKFLVQKFDWILSKVEKQKLVPVISRSESRKNYLQHKQAALKLAKERLEFYNRTYQFTYNNLSIKNAKSLWGSCSRLGNLNFNYKIVLLPQLLCDYIIVHELCHLKEFNHSQKFWDLVAQTIPDHKKRRRELKKIGMEIQ